MYFVEKRSKRAIHRLTGVHRDTIMRALCSDLPPKYARASVVGSLPIPRNVLFAESASETTESTGGRVGDTS
jgi:hypothetical protein